MKASTQIHDLDQKANYAPQFIAANIQHPNENKALGLKKGDRIEFWGGYDNNIRYRSTILGFNNEGRAYVNWDCYWFPVDLTEPGNRDFKKVQE